MNLFGWWAGIFATPLPKPKTAAQMNEAAADLQRRAWEAVLGKGCCEKDWGQ